MGIHFWVKGKMLGLNVELDMVVRTEKNIIFCPSSPTRKLVEFGVGEGCKPEVR